MRKLSRRRAKISIKRDAVLDSNASRNESLKSVNSPVNQVLNLQRVAGNHMVQDLLKSGVIQPKLKIGKPGDNCGRNRQDVFKKKGDRS